MVSNNKIYTFLYGAFPSKYTMKSRGLYFTIQTANEPITVHTEPERCNIEKYFITTLTDTEAFAFWPDDPLPDDAIFFFSIGVLGVLLLLKEKQIAQIMFHFPQVRIYLLISILFMNQVTFLKLIFLFSNFAGNHME